MDINKKESDIVYPTCDPSDPTVVPEDFLWSKGETLSVKARQKKVWRALQKLNINIQKNEEPPVIAVLGSGGGLRAMIGFLGVLAELAKEDILDAITYICGTSGSIWCMSSLYNNDKWSSCMEEMESQIADRLLNPSKDSEKTWEKLTQAQSHENYSMTDFWAYVFIQKMTKEIDENTLSNHQPSCENGENPYPIYSAVEKGCIHSNEAGAWFEFTPHLVGFPAYKAFIKTELFGSKFKEGKVVTKYPEIDLCYLQGMWGSAPANVMKNTIKDKIENLFPSFTNKVGTCLCSGCTKMGAFVSKYDLLGLTYTRLGNLFRDFDKIVHDACEKANSVRNVLKSFVDWRWGTTNNFLYKWRSNIPDELHNKKRLSLIDAGLEINSAYPLMLQPNRKVDLILSFDFSDGDPFLTLKNTDEFCKNNNIAFPEINIEDTESQAPSQSCYVFEGNGQGAPDVMHFPLFNNQSCEGEVHELRKTYSTFNISYDESELKELLKISKLNVELNKERILKQIQQVFKCKSSV